MPRVLLDRPFHYSTVLLRNPRLAKRSTRAHAGAHARLQGNEPRLRRCGPLKSVRLHWKRLKEVTLSIGAAILVFAAPAVAVAETAPELFTKSCAGCHAGGGNIVQRNAGLQAEDLSRNGVASSEEIYKLIYHGKGKMPGYGKDCAPRGRCTFAARLKDEDIASVTQYVQEQAADGWRS